MSAEDAGARLKRLTMRSWRRGTREMDLILGPFAEQHLATMCDADLMRYDAMLNENDHDLYRWLTGQAAAPLALQAVLDRVADVAKTRL